MDKRKKIILIIIAIVVVIGFGVKACSNKIGDVLSAVSSPDMDYDHAENYAPATTGAANVQNIRELEIAWITGNVSVKYAQQDSLTWSETYVHGEQNDINTLHYWMDGHTLYINYCASGKEAFSKRSRRGICKDLEVLVPQDWMLDEIEIHNLNGNITTQVDARDIDAESVNGEKTVCAQHVQKIKLSGVNGSNWIKLPQQTSFKAEFDKVNGGFSSDFPIEKEGNTYTSGNAPYVDIEVEVVNGGLNLQTL